MAGGKTVFLKQWNVRSLASVLISGLFLVTGSTADARAVSNNGESYSCNTLRKMARVYMAYGDYIKAQPLVAQALTLARANNVPDSELCSCLIDLAWLYENQGKFADAEKMCLEGLKIQEEVYDEDHPYVA